MEATVEAAPPGPPLEFRGRLDEADVGHIVWYADLLLVGRPVRCAADAALGLGCGVVGWCSVWWGFPPGVALFALIWAYFAFGFARERRWVARRAFRKNPGGYLESVVTLSAERVSLQNEALNTSTCWKLLGAVVDTPHGVMFCGGGFGVFFWLPDRLLGGGLRQEVLSLASSQGVHIRHLS